MSRRYYVSMKGLIVPSPIVFSPEHVPVTHLLWDAQAISEYLWPSYKSS